MNSLLSFILVSAAIGGGMLYTLTLLIKLYRKYRNYRLNMTDEKE
jgi:hypothetical protein